MLCEKMMSYIGYTGVPGMAPQVVGAVAGLRLRNGFWAGGNWKDLLWEWKNGRRWGRLRGEAYRSGEWLSTGTEEVLIRGQ